MLASPQAMSRKREGRLEDVVQGFAQDAADLALGQAIAFDQLAVGGPLFLELRQRRGVHDGAAGLELMDMNVDHGVAPRRE